MNIAIKRVENWLSVHPRAKEWAWFALLWCGGLFTVLALAYPIKWLIGNMH